MWPRDTLNKKQTSKSYL